MCAPLRTMSKCDGTSYLKVCNGFKHTTNMLSVSRGARLKFTSYTENIKRADVL